LEIEDRNQMPAPESFEDLDAWQAARELANEVYRLCRREPLACDFGLCDQLRRASVSVMNNIAEDWESLHLAEKKQFYNWSRRSCGEVRSMTYVLLDNEFVTPAERHSLLGQCIRVGKLVSGVIRALDNRS